MPRLTGPELAARLTRSEPRPKILYMSGYPAQVTPETRDPDVAFIHKPLTPGALLAAVRRLLDGYSP